MNEWRSQEDFSEPHPELLPAPTPELPPEPTTNAEPSPLHSSNLELLEENATTVKRSTVEEHINGTYNPGDRIAQQGERRPQRHPFRTGGYSCSFEGCGKPFNRQCEAT